MTNSQHTFLAQRKRFEADMVARYDIDAATYAAVSMLLAPLAVAVSLDKGDYLQRAGSLARHVYWITAGIVCCGVHTPSGDDITAAFFTEGHSATPYHDLLQGASGLPALHSLTAETAVQAFRLDWDKIVTLRSSHSVLDAYHLKVMEYMLKQQSRRSHAQYGAAAQTRLASFLRDYPGLERRISQKTLSSYLEITPQYLSQLLNRDKRKGGLMQDSAAHGQADGMTHVGAPARPH